jgi:hypothetical protein
VDKHLPAYEIPYVNHTNADFKCCVLHVKVSKIPGTNRPCHVLAVYLLSGGNFQRARTAIITDLLQLCKDTLI